MRAQASTTLNMSTELVTLAVCDDEPLAHEKLRHQLGSVFKLVPSHSTNELLDTIRVHRPALILLDLRLQVPDDGFAALARLRSEYPGIPVIIYSGMDDYPSVRRAMRSGAIDFILKTCPTPELRSALQQAVNRHGVKNINVNAPDLVGSSASIAELKATISRVRNARGNVIITGESGVGKEVVARLLRRQLSNGTLEPFVNVDSGTISQSMAESQLFGHERGSFTGADKQHIGLFEAANGGIIYFDELANMSLETQAKLLRVSQEKEVMRVGSTRAIPLQFRIISATNCDLVQLCRERSFRSDLLARLEVFPITLPPLRSRREDIPELVAHFVRRLFPSKAAPELAPATLDLLMAYEWPLNVRELGNAVEYALSFPDANPIEPRHLPTKIQALYGGQTPVGGTEGQAASVGSLNERVRSFERALLQREYDAADGNISRMARALETDRSNLYVKLMQHQIHCKK